MPYNCSFKPLYNAREKERRQGIGASSGGDPLQNDAKRPFKDKTRAFYRDFGVPICSAVARLTMWGLKRGFKCVLLVWGVSLIGLCAFRGF